MAPEPGRGSENAVQQWEVAGFDGVERGSVLLEEFAGLGPGRCVDPGGEHGAALVVGRPAGEPGGDAGFVDLVEQRKQPIGTGSVVVRRLVPERLPQGRPAHSEQVDLEGWVDAVEPAGIGG